MPITNLLFKKEYRINDDICIAIPTVGEVIEKEEEYYTLISLITAMPIDLMVQLDDIGIDFTTINEYELFLLLFGVLKTQDTSMIFKDMDLSQLQTAVNKQNGNVVLIDKNNKVIIDRAIHGQIANILRKIHHIERDIRKPGNDEAKKYLIERTRTKMQRRKNKPVESQLEPLIVAMVNTEQYKYNYDGTRELSIYQFNESVQQIIHKVDYEHRMAGVYAGTIDSKNLSQDEINWLKHK